MRRILIIIFALTVISCRQKGKSNPKRNTKAEIISTAEFKLIKAENQNGLLILFPCYPCDSKNTLSEFKISEISIKNGFSVLAMNLNQHLFLKQSERHQLAEQLEKINKNLEILTELLHQSLEIDKELRNTPKSKDVW